MDFILLLSFIYKWLFIGNIMPFMVIYWHIKIVKSLDHMKVPTLNGLLCVAENLL